MRRDKAMNAHARILVEDELEYVVEPRVDPWPDERVALMTKLWLDGLSAAQVAKQLGGGATRSSVFRKLQRLGMVDRPIPARLIPKPGKKRSGKTQAGPKRRPNVTPPRPPRAVCDPAVFQPLEGTAPRPFMDRPALGCAWPVEVDGATLACCAPIGVGSWCGDHARIGYLPLTPERMNRAARDLAYALRRAR